MRTTPCRISFRGLGLGMRVGDESRLLATPLLWRHVFEAGSPRLCDGDGVVWSGYTLKGMTGTQRHSVNELGEGVARPNLKDSTFVRSSERLLCEEIGNEI